MRSIRRYIALLLGVAMAVACSEQTPAPKRVALETTEGRIVAELSDKTPLHRDNFVQLAEEGYFDSLLFHRVIDDGGQISLSAQKIPRLLFRFPSCGNVRKRFIQRRRLFAVELYLAQKFLTNDHSHL